METENTSAGRTKRTRTRLLRLLLNISVAAVLCALVWLYGVDWIDGVRDRRVAAEEESHEITAENPPGPDTFYPRQVVDRRPPVTGYKVISVADADGQIDGDELVLGVSIEGEARAYPLNMMTDPDREIFNDELGGRAIAATW